MATNQTKAKATKKAGGGRPYNRYNLFFILERERLILDKGGNTKWSTNNSPPAVRPGYENLRLPPLPPRFAHLDVPESWCFPDRQARRPHRKSHGVASFRELAVEIARSWKTLAATDVETHQWCEAVEKVIKQRYEELKKLEANVDDASAVASSPSATAKRAAAAPNDKVPKQAAPKAKTRRVSVSSSTLLVGVLAPNETVASLGPPPEMIQQVFGNVNQEGSTSSLAVADFFWDQTEDTKLFHEVNAPTSDEFATLTAAVDPAQLISRRCSISNVSLESDTSIVCGSCSAGSSNVSIGPMSSLSSDKDTASMGEDRWAEDLMSNDPFISDDEIRKMWSLDN